MTRQLFLFSLLIVAYAAPLGADDTGTSTPVPTEQPTALERSSDLQLSFDSQRPYSEPTDLGQQQRRFYGGIAIMVGGVILLSVVASQFRSSHKSKSVLELIDSIVIDDRHRLLLVQLHDRLLVLAENQSGLTPVDTIRDSATIRAITRSAGRNRSGRWHGQGDAAAQIERLKQAFPFADPLASSSSPDLVRKGH
ncbi:MAG: flagellar biosynthetic protein FliO [Planctomycetales bacterium]|nr:flagellar biosynthetic protein FliO [Planctomycetales bacterium]